MLTFDSVSWHVPQSVTLAVKADAAVPVDGERVDLLHVVATSGADYAAIADDELSHRFTVFVKDSAAVAGSYLILGATVLASTMSILWLLSRRKNRLQAAAFKGEVDEWKKKAMALALEEEENEQVARQAYCRGAFVWRCRPL